MNACLDRVTEVTDESPGRVRNRAGHPQGSVDGLEARVGELEATQFSTTKLKGVTQWAFGAANFSGESGQQLVIWPGPKDERSVSNYEDFNKTSGGTSFSYNLALNLETSFTGKDLLYTRLRSGNMDNVYGPDGLFAQEYGFDSKDSENCSYYSSLWRGIHCGWWPSRPDGRHVGAVASAYPST